LTDKGNVPIHKGSNAAREGFDIAVVQLLLLSGHHVKED
jgi:hypothetical protein